MFSITSIVPRSRVHSHPQTPPQAHLLKLWHYFSNLVLPPSDLHFDHTPPSLSSKRVCPGALQSQHVTS